MYFLYFTFIYQPLLNALIFLYNTVAFHDLGVAIIVLTIIIRSILYPIFHHSTRNQRIMQKLQPKIKKIQEEHKGNMERQGHAMMELYKEHKVHPLSGVLLVFAQLPVLIALFQLLRELGPKTLEHLYVFVAQPEKLNSVFLGLINLQEHNMLIVALAVVAQYIQGKLLVKGMASDGASPQRMANQVMTVVGPALTALLLWQLPAAIGLYWLATSIISAIQQYVINKKLEHVELENIRTHTG